MVSAYQSSSRINQPIVLLNRKSMNGDRDTVANSEVPCWRTHLLRAQHWGGRLLLGYALALFTGTHLPNPEGLFPIEGNDKWLHFCAYLGLAFLLAAWRVSKASITARVTCGIWCVTALLGAADELTQMIPGINRQCDFADWIADVSGSASGLLIWHLLRRTLFARGRGLKLHDDSVQE